MKKTLLVLLFLLISLFIASASYYEEGCWNINDQQTCDASSNCLWKTEQSFGGWCSKPGCWDYWNQTSCNADSECEWMTDHCEEKQCWNSNDQTNCEADSCEWNVNGWCEEEGCWNYNNQTGCSSDANCTWDNQWCRELGPWDHKDETACTGAGYTWEANGWCEDPGCWNYWNQTACNADSSGFGNCNWNSEYNYCNEIGCWDYSDNTTCLSNVDCSWDTYGQYCYEEGCWNYGDNTTCLADSECSWNSQDNYCFEDGAWNYNDSTSCQGAGFNWRDYGWCKDAGCWDYYNQTACTGDSTCSWDTEYSYCYEKPLDCWNNSDSTSCGAIQGCNWRNQGGWCSKPGCRDYDYTNQSTCESNGCTWEDPWCREADCWDNGNSTSCLAVEGCEWQTPEAWGWCEEQGCWNYDYNQTACENSNTTIGVECVYDAPWCDPKDCAIYDFTNKSACENNTDGFVCLYEEFETGICDPPGGECGQFNGDQQGCWDTMWCAWDPANQTCFEPGFTGPMFNPECFIFDNNQAECQNVTGCTYIAGECEGNDAGIYCENITNKDLCTDIPMLSTCCEWKNGGCESAQSSTDCWDNMQPPPEGANFCEDYNALTSESVCNQIAGSPWYMPCKWNNETENCVFKHDDFFNGGKGGFGDINTKSNCEFAGGTWIVESWIDSQNITYTDEWCEMGFGQGSCDSECWACEYQDDGSNWNIVDEAQTACEGSALGFCEFRADSNAYNGYGWCDPKPEVTYGGASCSKECWGCFNQNDCEDSTVGCKWFTDPADASIGWCDLETMKSCEDDCWQCFDQNSCEDVGLGGGSCTWDSSNYYCKPANFNDEICFDGMDNDNDGMVDCADPFCMFDPFCGGHMLSDCGKYAQNEPCLADISGECIWIEDTVTGGEWCGRQGENCWMFDELGSCGSESGCAWRESEVGFCDINEAKVSKCFTIASRSNCIADSDCSWIDEPWNPSGGFCDSKLFQCHELSKSQCGAGEYTYCAWNNDPFSPEGGWCDPKCFSPEYNTDSNASCINDQYCSWIHGRCEPEMFMMTECWQYDGNQTACDVEDACQWYGEDGGECDTDESGQCWEYDGQSNCESNGCTWITDARGNSWCDTQFETCFQYDYNQTGCEAQTSVCQWFATEQICDPICFEMDQSTCGSTSGCAWLDGYCDPKMLGEMFEGMEGGEPVMLGFDQCPEVTIPEVADICGFGLKEMSDSYAFGTEVDWFGEAAACNGMPTDDGMGSGFEGAKFYYYLDTDGVANNNCDSQDGGQTGFEFFLKYESEWSDGGLSEIKVAYKCMNGTWAPTPIALSNWNMIMCSEIEGGMIAIDKASLKKFTNLFDATKDMRIYATTAGSSGSAENPDDTVGPSYYTPGTIDFKFEECTAIGVDIDGDGFTSENDPDCMDFKRYGYIPTEDCWDSVDNDGNQLADCNDPACTLMPHCSSSGTDNTAPKVTWLEVEEFTDFASIKLSTDEPTNGTVKLYTTDCLGNYTTILDPTLSNSFSEDDYIMWHDFPVDSLQTSTTYNYKTVVCDPSGNCGYSACLNFTTAANESEFTVGFDYEEETGVFLNDLVIKINGQEFDFNQSGKKFNISRDANLSIGNPNAQTAWEITLVGVDFTQRNVFNITGDLLSGLSGDDVFVGMAHGAWLELLQSLGVESILLTIGIVADTIYHCDDNSTNCADVTSICDKVSTTSTTTTWECPTSLGFSVFKFEETDSNNNNNNDGGGSSGGSSGSIGGGSVLYSTNSNASEAYLIRSCLKAGQEVSFYIKRDKKIIASMTNVFNNAVNMKISEEKVTIIVNETKDMDIDNNGKEDVRADLYAIENNRGCIWFYELRELEDNVEPQEDTVPQVEEEVQEVTVPETSQELVKEPVETEVIEEPENETGIGSITGMAASKFAKGSIIGAIFVAILIVALIHLFKGGGKEEGEYIEIEVPEDYKEEGELEEDKE